MRYSLNARGNIILQVLKKAFGLNTGEVLKLINEDFETMKSTLWEKGIAYTDLKSVLTPPHKSNRREIVLCFDSGRIEDCWYGNLVMEQVLSNINKKRNHAIFQGDFYVSNELNEYAFSCL